MHGPARALMLDDGTVFGEAVSDWHAIQVPSWFDRPSPGNFGASAFSNLTFTSVSWQVVTCPRDREGVGGQPDAVARCNQMQHILTEQSLHIGEHEVSSRRLPSACQLLSSLSRAIYKHTRPRTR